MSSLSNRQMQDIDLVRKIRLLAQESGYAISAMQIVNASGVMKRYEKGTALMNDWEVFVETAHRIVHQNADIRYMETYHGCPHVLSYLEDGVYITVGFKPKAKTM